MTHTVQVVSHKWFEPLIAVIIVWSAVMLAIRNPNRPTQVALKLNPRYGVPHSSIRLLKTIIMPAYN